VLRRAPGERVAVLPPARRAAARPVTTSTLALGSSSRCICGVRRGNGGGVGRVSEHSVSAQRLLRARVVTAAQRAAAGQQRAHARVCAACCNTAWCHRMHLTCAGPSPAGHMHANCALMSGAQ
jgi:hypothetical protein